MKSGVVVFIGNPLKRNKGAINNRIDKIVSTVEDYYGVDAYEVSRKHDIVFARSVAMYLLRTKVMLKTQAIGNLFGKDHSTVVHAIKTIHGFCSFDLEIKKQVDELSSKIE